MARFELGPQPLLPRELWWFLPVGPVFAAVLIVNGITEMTWRQVIRHGVTFLLPFCVLGGTFFALYEWVMPRLVERVKSGVGRALIHIVAVTLVSSVLALMLFPVHQRICASEVYAVEYVLQSIVISSLMTFPALIFQTQRTRAAALERQAAMERQATLRAQLAALQARTNPHFFFNSVNTVAALISEDPVLAERTLERLADLFRYALDSANTPRVPLAKEFAMVRDYLAIQQARFGDRLRASVELPSALESIEIPPLVLQPLVENAVLHGLSERSQGTVRVVARRAGARVILEVTDDGPGPGASTHRGTQTSIKELTQRLALAWGEGAELVLERGATGGCVARVAVPA
jgi:two-component system sensor histidine kinase AlgZ